MEKYPPPWCCIRLFSGHVCGLRYVRRSGPSTAVGNVSLLNGAWGGRHEAWSWVLEMGYHPETNWCLVGNGWVAGGCWDDYY